MIVSLYTERAGAEAVYSADSYPVGVPLVGYKPGLGPANRPASVSSIAGISNLCHHNFLAAITLQFFHVSHSYFNYLEVLFLLWLGMELRAPSLV